ncbi:MAG TPA: RNA methyltransferase [Candidatus Omnitrophota bacterium]|nr:RNA methyltransferase [Candidatus Omnitrophota bacterium]
MPEIISSVTNPKIKHIVALRDRRSRKQDDLTIIEGEREIWMALEAKVDVRELYWFGESQDPLKAKIMDRLNSAKKPIYETSAPVFKKIAYGDREQGLLCLAKVAELGLNDMPKKEKAVYVVIERVEKPGNLGAILRSCDGAGADAVIVCDPSTDIHNPNAIRSSLGTVFTMKVAVTTSDKAYEFLKKNNVEVIATSPQAKKLYTQIDVNKSLALIVGSEREGLSPFWLRKAQQTLRIPMKGRVDSLNVSVSTAIVLYEINRQRSQ